MLGSTCTEDAAEWAAPPTTHSPARARAAPAKDRVPPPGSGGMAGPAVQASLAGSYSSTDLHAQVVQLNKKQHMAAIVCYVQGNTLVLKSTQP